MPETVPPAPRAVCNGCGASAVLQPGQGSDPDAAVVCAPDSGCCQVEHSHAGTGCDRTITVWGVSALTGEAG